MLAEARTVLARSPARLLDFLATVRKPAAPTTVLYALSSNSWEDAIVRRLAGLAPHSAGCISAPLQSLEGMSALSLAFIRDERCTPLHWTKPVEHDSADDWASDTLGEQALSSNSNDPDQFVFDRGLAPEDVQAVVSFSSPTCSNDFHKAVHKRFPGASQIGLSASHTPFVNGIPFTLFKNGSVISDGAVGLALHGPKRLQPSFALGGFRAISSPVKVSSARGNIVHALGKDKATRHLLAAIHGAGLDTENSKDDEFFLALFPRGDSAPTASSPHDAVLQINSGDPSRGSIAVESEWGPSIGDYVQILHRSLSEEATTHLRDARADRDPPLLRFSATTLEQLYEGRGRAPDEVIDVPGVFEACSENGFVVYSGARQPWTCKFPGVTAALEF